MRDPLPVTPLVSAPDCTVAIPGSKSITNRALIAAALADGTSVLQGALIADDTLAMISVLETLGIATDIDESDSNITVNGRGGVFPSEDAQLDARQSGTTSRFIAAVAALGSEPVVVDGHPQMRDRPFGDLIAALSSLGVEVESLGVPGHLPLRLTGPLRGGSVSIPGDVSSQFISALMLAGAIGGLTISLTTEPVSLPYLQMTTRVMDSFGASTRRDESVWEVGGGYSPVDAYVIEPDASAASYFFGAAAITGGRVRIDGLGTDSMQGDLAFVDVLAQMGCSVEQGDTYTEVVGADLHGIEIDMRHISDTAPTLAAVAAFAEGTTTVTGIGFVRGKESDRIAGPVAELRRCGIDARATDDGFTITPARRPHAAVFDTYEDHRMAMSFALIGLVTPGIEVSDPGCVAKTFPEFFDVLGRLR